MDKIEKLMHIKTDKNQHVSPDTVFEMCCKINEITDILNSRLFEPIITVHNQSQKQPEGEEYEQPIKVRKYPKLEGSEKPCSENKIEDIYVYRKPEKQKDWRDRIQSFSLGVSESFKIDGEYIDSKEELVAFISQLLSERTFTKDELEIIDDWAEWDYCTNKDVVRVKDKVSKLLKEEK